MSMRDMFIALFFYCFMPMASLAQSSLTIEITDVRNNEGQIHLELSNEHGERVVGITRSISDNTCIIVIDSLSPGKYAFKFFHDENKNDTLDVNWIGIPKEGFGFSNNPRMIFGPPSFKRTIFDLVESKKIKTKPTYF